MMSIRRLTVRLDDAEAVVAEAAETAARAHEDAPGSGIEADALDELVLALRERDMHQAHLNEAMRREADEAADEGLETIP